MLDLACVKSVKLFKNIACPNWFIKSKYCKKKY